MRILVTPLDWGLGHATRCVPIIQALQKNGHIVIAGVDGGGYQLLSQEFPEMEIFRYPGFRMQYGRGKTMNLTLAWQLIPFLLGIWKEKQVLKTLIPKWELDAVISDNRYGCYHPSIASIFITHQVFPKLPFKPGVLSKVFRTLLYMILRKFYRNFHQVWIPDWQKDPNLSGVLSHGYTLPGNFRFIGPLSRFTKPLTEKPPSKTEGNYDLTAIISGPEPQRTILYKMVKEQFKKITGNHLLVAGKPGKSLLRQKMGHITEINHMDSEELFTAMVHSECIICRPGYSTIMDLEMLGRKKVVFIPTPGQPEQQYLAELMHEKGIAPFCLQDELQLTAIIKQLGQYHGFPVRYQKTNCLERLAAMFEPNAIFINLSENSMESMEQ